MKEITLKVPDNKLRFFLELIHQLGLKVKDEEHDIPDWQKKEVSKRLKDFKKNPDQAMDFDTTMDDIEKEL
jgi:hypothetical protein